MKKPTIVSRESLKHEFSAPLSFLQHHPLPLLSVCSVRRRHNMEIRNCFADETKRTWKFTQQPVQSCVMWKEETQVSHWLVLCLGSLQHYWQSELPNVRDTWWSFTLMSNIVLNCTYLPSPNLSLSPRCALHTCCQWCPCVRDTLEWRRTSRECVIEHKKLLRMLWGVVGEQALR